MKVKFKHWNCIAVGNYYGNGNKAVQLIDAEDKEPVATATVNLVEEKIDKNKAFIKDYSENEGMSTALFEAGIIELPIYGMVQTGYVMVHLHQFTQKALDQLW